MRLTTEQFITRARLVHGDTYDYSSVVYVHNKNKVTILCHKHGSFEQRPNDHLNGVGCPTCGGTQRLTTRDFIERAQQIHGDRYDYSQTEYIGTSVKVKIICRTHGPYYTKPNDHLNGHNCPLCSTTRRLTTEEFINNAREVHGDRYDYSQVEYVNTKSKVVILCREHGSFNQIPNDHLHGSGCVKCSIVAQHNTTEVFIEHAQEVHGDRYDYSLVEYTTCLTPVVIQCLIHGGFTQTPNSHLAGSNCPQCSTTRRTTTEEFIIKAQKVHGNRYDYSRVEYVGIKQKLTIICPEHGPFDQRPNDHLSGRGCPRCYWTNIRSTTEDFVDKAQTIHGNRYDYSRVNYIRTNVKVTIVCCEHGPFDQRPSGHLMGNGCPRCNTIGHSQKCIQWLDEVSKQQNIHIQHAENDGEFRIPGTRWKADGYCKETNTIYEFHGDAYHGNPRRYSPTECCNHFHPTKTAAELHEKTIAREEKIRALGYKLVVQWESEFNNRMENHK